MSDQFDPDALRKEFADYCDEVAPGIKAKAPRLNQMETLALIGMTLFQAAKELKAERNQLAEEVSGLRSARIAYASEFPLNADGEPDVGNVHANIRAMKARIQWLELENGKLRYSSPVAAGTMANLYDRLMCGAVDIGEAYLELNVVGYPPTLEEFIAASEPKKEPT